MNQVLSSGYVAIVGRPNVGKSTLLNALIGKKISIMTPKPQTTRHQILGIKTIGSAQIVYIDTPGLHETQQRAMSRYLNRLAASVIPDADVVLFVIEAGKWLPEDDLVLTQLAQAKRPVILVINKIDKLKDKAQLLPLIEKLQEKLSFAHIVPLSAKNNENVQELEKTIIKMLPEGPHFFEAEQVTDKNVQFQIAEIVREKLILSTGQELPYSTAVIVESMKENVKKIAEISVVIWVERDGQKPIVIGKNGERLKKIGTAARKEIEKLLIKKFFYDCGSK